MDSAVFPQLPTYLFEPSLAGVLSLLITIALPIIAALFMRASWSPTRKGLVLLALSAVKAFLEAWLGAATSHEHFVILNAAYSTIVQFIVAVGMYVGLLKGSPVQQAALNGGVVND